MTEEQTQAHNDETYRLWKESVKEHLEKMKSQIDYDHKILDLDKKRYSHELEWYYECCAEAGIDA